MTDRVVATPGGGRLVALTPQQAASREKEERDAGQGRADRAQRATSRAIKLSALPGNENSVPALRQKINDILEILRDGATP